MKYYKFKKDILNIMLNKSVKDRQRKKDTI